MAASGPYPVRAFISLANNTLMSFANTRRIDDGLMKQDLIVACEHMTCTAGVRCESKAAHPLEMLMKPLILYGAPFPNPFAP